MIISASRRTDIPAFYGKWFISRLREGYCLVSNPLKPTAVTRVSLKPEDVDVIAFWTKNPEPIISCLEEIDRMGFNYFFLLTLNHYTERLEPGMPPVDDRIRIFHELAKRIGAARIIWRYDPVILSRRFDASYHIHTFEKIARALRRSTERVIISFVDFYRKTERRLSQVEKRTTDEFCRDPFTHPEFKTVVDGLAEIAARNRLEIQSCAEDPRLERLGIKAGKCIDDELIHRMFGITVSARKDTGQRDKCRCVVSRDIGANDSCLNGCEYCYSTASLKKAQVRFRQHDPSSPFLIPSSGRFLNRCV